MVLQAPPFAEISRRQLPLGNDGEGEGRGHERRERDGTDRDGTGRDGKRVNVNILSHEKFSVNIFLVLSFGIEGLSNFMGRSWEMSLLSLLFLTSRLLVRALKNYQFEWRKSVHMVTQSYYQSTYPIFV